MKTKQKSEATKNSSNYTASLNGSNDHILDTEGKETERYLMRTHMVAGGGGTKLHILETGNLRGRPIIFIHGFSQCSLSWIRQINSNLADDHRLIAMDLRGHGLSDKPIDAYSDSKLWADDINSVIQTLELVDPILCGWSYGPLVILDYIRHYGEDKIGGVNFVGGITKLGSEEAMSVLTPEFISLVPGFFSDDSVESMRSLESLIKLCLVKDPSMSELYQMLGFNLSVPPYVRHAMLSRSFDNDDLLPKICKPVLLTQGENDRVVKQAAVYQHLHGMPHAKIMLISKGGHAPFWDNAEIFNSQLREFAENI